MELAADLAKKFFGKLDRVCGKTVALIPVCIQCALAIDEMEAWHARVIQVETSVNPSSKRLHTTILEMDAPLGGTRMQSIRGCGTPMPL